MKGRPGVAKFLCASAGFHEIEPMPETEVIRAKLRELPHRPGVYLMKDRFGTVIYVGKARDLRKRVSQYFHPSRRLGWDLKFNALVDAIHDLDVHVVRSEPEALLLEGKLIKEFHPRYNISFRDDKRFLLVKVNLNDPIPRFTLTRLRTEDGARYFGPFPNGGALRSTLVHDAAQVQSARLPSAHPHRGRLHATASTATSSGAPPPASATSPASNTIEQVRAACDFLDGQCEELAGELEESRCKRPRPPRNTRRPPSCAIAIEDLKRTTRKTTRFERTPWNLPVALMPERRQRRTGARAGPARAAPRASRASTSRTSAARSRWPAW